MPSRTADSHGARTATLCQFDVERSVTRPSALEIANLKLLTAEATTNLTDALPLCAMPPPPQVRWTRSPTAPSSRRST